MQTEAAQMSDHSSPMFHRETHAVIDEDVIDLDEDLFPWDGSDDLEAYVDVYGEERGPATMNGYAAEPSWRRIERFKDQRRLHRQIEDIV